MLIYIAIVLYILTILGIGYFVSKRIKSDEDYFLAGRSLGLGFASMSIFATWFGAETCMGSAAAIFQSGLSGSRADPFGYTLCLLIAGFFLASKLWRLNITTLGDFYERRFSGSVEKVAVLIMIPSSMLWAAAQVRAFGQIISSVSPLDANTGITIAIMVVISYTLLGGILGDVINDVFQGIVLLVGLAAVLYFALDHLGGFWQALEKVEPLRWNFVGTDESFTARVDRWLVPVIGSLIAQEMISRMLAARSAPVARNATLLGACIYITAGLIPVFIGLIGSQIFDVSHLQHTDQFLPELAKSLLPTAMFVVFIGALIAAILSTVDSALLAISAFVTHNVFHRHYYPLSEKKKVFYSRLVVFTAGIIAYWMAIQADGIYELVQESSSFGSAGVVIITLLGLASYRFAHSKAALGALLTGLVMTPLLDKVLNFDAPFLGSLVAALVVYLSIGIFFERTKGQLNPSRKT